ncbi:MAG: hypothetical protein AAFX99_13540 [Myxococcota bacterium]
MLVTLPSPMAYLGVVGLLGLALGCATDANSPTTPSRPDQPPSSPTAAPRPLPKALPEPIDAAVNNTEKLFACLEYNHVDLLATTDRKDYDAVLERLGELRAAQTICVGLVQRMLEGFEPAVLEFEAEWSFYTTYFALTTEVFTDHNPQTFCRHLDQTVQAAQLAQRHARIYHQWLTREVESATEQHPYMADMVVRATEKVSGLTIAARELDTQYQKECTP